MWQSFWTLWALDLLGLAIWTIASNTLDRVFKAIFHSRYGEGSRANFADRLESRGAEYNKKIKEVNSKLEEEIATLEQRLKLAEQTKNEETATLEQRLKFAEQTKEEETATLERRLKLAEQTIQELTYDLQTSSASTHPAEHTKKEAEVAVQTVTSRVFIQGPPEAYKNESIPRGLVVIFNWNEYDGTTETKESERLGSKRDVENVIKVFDQIGYVTRSLENLTKGELLEELTNLNKFKCLSCVDSFLSFFMSHGSNDKLVTSEGERINFREICSYFDNDHCRILSGKPKVFFFVFCRRNLQRGEATDNLDGGVILASTTSHPMTKQSDLHIIFSTLYGDVSHRSPITGSLFIQELCQVIQERAHDSTLDDLVNKINNNLITKPDQQICELRKLGCTKNLYLNQIVKNEKCQPSIPEGSSEVCENKPDLGDSGNFKSNKRALGWHNSLIKFIKSLLSSGDYVTLVGRIVAAGITIYLYLLSVSCKKFRDCMAKHAEDRAFATDH